MPQAAVLIGLAISAIEMGIRLAQSANSLPDANSPEALAKLKELEARLPKTLSEVMALEIKDV